MRKSCLKSHRKTKTILFRGSSVAELLEQRQLLAYATPVDPRIVTNLDTSWKFNRADVASAQTVAFNDSAWTSLSVPHTWNATDGQDGGSNYYRGIGWYRRHLTPANSLSGKSLYLKFDGASIVTDLYINGSLVGEHQGAYAAFGWDVTSYLTLGADNVIAVKVNNAYNANIGNLGGDYTFFGGIYRHVNLIATESEHVALQEVIPIDASGIGPSVSYTINTPGVYLTPSAITNTSANLSIKALLRNDSLVNKSIGVTGDVVDAAGNLVATVSSEPTVAASSSLSVTLNTTIANPHRWNGQADPYLYKVYLVLRNGTSIRDVVVQPLGFRTFTVDPSTGARLNGNYIDLHGVNFHQDRLNKGWAISDADQTQDIDLIQEMGANFVRLSHYQHPQLTYDLLDQRGIAAWSEIPMNSADLGSTTAYLDNAKQQLQEMIRQNINHPSVLVWGMFNEISDTTTNRSVVTALNNLSHQEDTTRMTVCASNRSAASQINWIPDVMGFNEYYGWYGGVFSDVVGFLDSTHATYPTRAIGMSEYGAGAALSQHSDNPSAPPPYGSPHPEEWQNLYHEFYWKTMKTRPWIWEKTIWNMFDFAVDSRNEGDTPGRNDKGMMSYDRVTRKDAFYFYKANWSSSPVLYITSRRFTSRAASTIPVKIYANMDSVTLTLNGVVIGTLTSATNPDRVFSWSNLPIVDGTNTISVSGIRNGVTYTDTTTFTNTLPPPPLEHIAALTGTNYARINFQPAASTTIAGYSPDNGLVYGLRSSGLTYGWNADNSANTRERTTGFLGTPPDSRYARFVHMQVGGTFNWDLSVPNGTYDVHLVAGDPNYTDSTYALNLEGRLALSGTTSTGALWLDSIVRVNVTDGKLSLSVATGGANNKVDFIEVNTAVISTVTGTSGNDTFRFARSGTNLNIYLNNLVTPVYTTNFATQGPISIDGLGGTDTLEVVGTSAAGTTNFSSGSIAFEGVSLNYSNVELLKYDGLLGRDIVSVNSGLAVSTSVTQELASLALVSGTAFNLVAGANIVVDTNTLSLAAGSRLDLADNAMIVRTTGALPSITTKILTGQNGFDNINGQANWNGNGIVSSAARSQNVALGVDAFSVGAIRNGDLDDLNGPGSRYTTWKGRTVGAEDVLIRYTYLGDADMNGTVTIDDYNLVDGTVLNLFPNKGWVSGNFDYTGSITIDDYNAIDTGYLYQAGSLGV